MLHWILMISGGLNFWKLALPNLKLINLDFVFTKLDPAIHKWHKHGFFIRRFIFKTLSQEHRWKWQIAVWGTTSEIIFKGLPITFFFCGYAKINCVRVEWKNLIFQMIGAFSWIWYWQKIAKQHSRWMCIGISISIQIIFLMAVARSELLELFLYKGYAGIYEPF